MRQLQLVRRGCPCGSGRPGPPHRTARTGRSVSVHVRQSDGRDPAGAHAGVPNRRGWGIGVLSQRKMIFCAVPVGWSESGSFVLTHRPAGQHPKVDEVAIHGRGDAMGVEPLNPDFTQARGLRLGLSAATGRCPERVGPPDALLGAARWPSDEPSRQSRRSPAASHATAS